jgi:hypothetical protein
MCGRRADGTVLGVRSQRIEEDAMKVLIATLAAGAAVAAAVALPAVGEQSPATRTLTLTSVQARGGERAIDLPPKGDSVGDRFAFASTLRNGRAMAGRMEGDCEAIDVKFEGMQCTLTAVLTDGTITLQGVMLGKRLPGAPTVAAETYAVTGGTGTYVGASGTMTRSGNGKVDTDVFSLE